MFNHHWKLIAIFVAVVLVLAVAAITDHSGGAFCGHLSDAACLGVAR